MSSTPAAPSGLKTRISAALGALVALGFGCLIAFVLAEVAIRIVATQPAIEFTPGIFTDDPPRRYRLTPGYQGRLANGVEFDTEIRIDSAGLRDRVPADSGEVAARRILVVGDSYVFGWGVEAEDAFPQILDRRLGEDVRVLNAGVPGFAPQDELEWYEAWGRPLEPDVVLLMVYVGNDGYEATAAYRALDPVDARPRDASAGRRWVADAVGSLQVLRWVKNGIPVAIQKPLRSALGLSMPFGIRQLLDGMGFCADELSELAREGNEANRRAIEGWAAIAATDGVEVRLVIAPSPIQVNDDAWLGTLRYLDLDPATHDARRPLEFFAEAGARVGIPVLDLTPELRRQAEDEPMYFHHDPHWNAAGQRVAADAIERWLSQPLEAPDGQPAKS